MSQMAILRQPSSTIYRVERGRSFMYLIRLLALPLLISLCVAPLAIAGNDMCMQALENPFPRPILFQQLRTVPFHQDEINLTHIIPPPEFGAHLKMVDARGVSLFRTPLWPLRTGGVSCERNGRVFSIHGRQLLNYVKTAYRKREAK
jgi:hypothetical protein